MTADELARFERERRDADRRYNDALTALDREVVSLDGREWSRDDAARIGSTLLRFLQQITAFVDTRDRQLAAEDKARIDVLTRALADLDELKTQTTVMRRAIESVIAARRMAAPSQQTVGHARRRCPPSRVRPRTRTSSTSGSKINSAARMQQSPTAARLCPGLRRLHGRPRLGCGRGELLAALGDAGIRARGIDANESTGDRRARSRRRRRTRRRAQLPVEAAPPASLGGLVATQVVEHLSRRT